MLGLQRLARLLQSIAADLVHAFGLEADLWMRPAARLAGIPVVIGSWRRHEDPKARRVRWARRLRGAADCVVATTPELAAEARDLARVRDDQICVVPPAVDVDDLRRKERPGDLLEPLVRAGAVTALDGAHGGDVLVLAAARLA